MADSKISELVDGTTPADTDLFPVARPGSPNETLRLLWSSIKAAVKTYTDTLYPSGSGTSTGTNTGDQTSVSGNAGTATALATGRTIDGQTFDGTANITVIAPGSHAASSKTTPVDADELPLVDSAASNVLKKLTWANLKATLKAYTDTLYPSGSGTSSGTNTGDQTISDATISTTDVTTNNVSPAKHGFAPKAPNDATKFLDGTGAYSTPSGGTADKLGLTPTAVKTSAYGASAGDLVPVDTTSGAVTVTLPTAPSDGSVVGIKHVIQGGTNSVTYATGGSDVINKASGATAGTLPLLAQGVLLQYKSSSAIWYVVANDVALAQLDSRYWLQTTPLGAGVYGDGSDGTVTFDGTTVILGLTPSSSIYTLTRDIFLAAGTVNNGVQIKTNGFRIYCQGTLTNNGTIQWNGSAGAASGAGNGASNTSSTLSNASFATNGVAGGTGVGANGNNNAVQGYGGAGGTGGTGSSAGGTGGTVVAVGVTKGTLRTLPQAALGLLVFVATSPAQVGAGAGGGAGGGDGSNTAGGSGGGGGAVLVCARAFAGTGSIQARGGNGGTPNTGNTGGGGGGGGGWVVVVSGSVSGGAIAGQTIDANGGTKGSPHGTGTDNATGGSSGTVILVPN